MRKKDKEVFSGLLFVLLFWPVVMLYYILKAIFILLYKLLYWIFTRSSASVQYEEVHWKKSKSRKISNETSDERAISIIASIQNSLRYS